MTSSAVIQHDHVVQFYEDDAFLVASVRQFLAPALREGATAIIVANASHRRDLERALASTGIDVGAAHAQGRAILLDADESLAEFMVDGAPDPERFSRVFGQLIGAAATRGPVRIFGEMVAVLWSRGQVAAAVALEELWNQLADAHPFALFCAYPMAYFSREASSEPFRQVCDAHSRVIPSERFSGLDDSDQRGREVALLQQRANVGTFETEALRAKQAQLEDALQRLQELDRLRNEFVAMVVHDIRSPTTVLRGFLEMLRSSWSGLSGDEIDDILRRGIENAEHIERLAGDILTVSQLESGDFEYRIKSFDLAEVIYRVVGRLRDGIPSRPIEVSVPADLPAALGDPARQMQILDNLLTNAVKFSPDASIVRVVVGRRSGELVVEVRDHGAGIDEAEAASKLFRRFSRLVPRGYEHVKGTGLGLYITKALVEGQRGRIGVTSTPGRGSTFWFTVPTAG